MSKVPLLAAGAVLAFSAFWASQATRPRTGIGAVGGRTEAKHAKRVIGAAVGGESSMEHEEAYHGQRIIVTTQQHAEGDWTSKAELLESGRRVPVEAGSNNRYSSEEEARQAALSSAAGAIDRARISKGKP